MKRLLLSALVVLFAIPAQAQVDRATLSGTVRDSLGALVSGASVVITNSATNVASSTKTNSEGNYTAVNLTPGRYTVAVEASGFQKTSQAVVLEIGQRARADFSLGVGTRSEAVEVQGTSSVLNTEQAALGTVIEQKSVANLPLASRNWDDLLFLVAGVQGDRYTDQGAARPSAAREASTSTASARSRTTSRSTASTTTPSPRTSRSSPPRSRVPRSTPSRSSRSSRAPTRRSTAAPPAGPSASAPSPAPTRSTAPPTSTSATTASTRSTTSRSSTSSRSS